ncbi:hypothetical protein [Chitinimonas lacunae]|uniref:Uncharacterized protein n=1 Tax=Chitinimonas lacunae TaxID=1963018 RepID=A0ABV8MWT6_9NEIS
MKNRFAHFLLTGKAATLPVLIGHQAMAAVTPTFEQLTTDKLSLVELPKAGEIELGNAYGANPYGDGMVMLCNGRNPQIMSTVLTGLRDGAQVFLAAATDRDDSFHLALNPKLRIGRQNLTIVTSFIYGVSPRMEDAAEVKAGFGTVTVPVNLEKLRAKGFPMALNGTFYLQALVIPPNVSDWNQFAYSELDQVKVQTCGTTYGNGS